MIPVVILPQVWPMLLESADWYDLELAGLGSMYLRAVESTFDLIAENPARFAKVHRDARRATVPRFPFGVYFVVRHNTIYVFSVVHLHRHSKRWKKFLPKAG